MKKKTDQNEVDCVASSPHFLPRLTYLLILEQFDLRDIVYHQWEYTIVG